MFPIDVDISAINNTTSSTADDVSRDIGRSLKFDYASQRFIFKDGRNVEPGKVDAIKQWIELFIRTELNKYEIYTDTFGVDFSGLLSYRLPRGFQVAEIMRTINAGILNKCPNVVAVSNWNFEKGTFSFTVTTDTGEEVVISE